MRFLMVDRICELERGKRARGIKNITWNDDFLEETFPGITIFSPVIAVEAVTIEVITANQTGKAFMNEPTLLITSPPEPCI